MLAPRLRSALPAALLAAACTMPHAALAARAPEWPAADGLATELVARGLRSPVFVTAPPGDARLFVVEQPGRIRIVRDGRLIERAFLDLTDRVGFGGERGLLGLAFHPQYARNGFFFVNYTDRRGDTRVVRFRVSPDRDVADPASARELFLVEQPYSNHNGGMIAFAPDGRLWIGMGDGGSGGDPHGNGQDDGTRLAKLLRLDVDREGAEPEVWAKGVRNPWRFSFDRGSNLVYVADVGQNAWEEVNVADARTRGLNYGWNRREGLHAFRGGTRPERALDPVVEYGHDDGCSVTGGYVYRGRAIPWLAGTYLFSDYCRGWLRSFRWDGERAVERREWRVGPLGSVTSFGEDAAGELYVTDAEGSVLRLVAAPPPAPRRAR
ncbi:MAG: PQQ-dependent sugar dehydrogenase [Candidatus Eisenbacteria bacterium]